MTQGFEQRQVIDSGSPSGQANTPARQLGLVNVQAPRGGNMSKVGSEYRMLAEVAKLGGVVMDSYLDKKKEKDQVTQTIAHTQGKTEQDLIDSGYKGSFETYRGLQAKDGYNKWMIQSRHNLEVQDHSMSPEQYRTQLEEQVEELYSTVPEGDEGTRKLVASMVSDGMSKLVSEHMVRHTQFVEGETLGGLSNLLVSESQLGDVDSLGTVIANLEDLAPNVAPSQRTAAVHDAVLTTLNDGNTALYDFIGGSEGLRSLGASNAQVQSAKKAYKASLSIEESEDAAAIKKGVHGILKRIKQNKLGEDEALVELENLRANVTITDSYYRTLQEQVMDSVLGTQDDKDLRDKLYNPDFVQESAALMSTVGLQGLAQTKGIQKVHALAEKYELPPEIVEKQLNAVVSANNAYMKRQETDVLNAIKDQQKQLKKEQRAQSLINSGFANLDTYSKEEQQLAMQMQKQGIMQEVVQDEDFDTDEEKTAEFLRRYVGFMRTSPVRDRNLQQQLGLIGQTAPLNAQGTLEPSHLQAYQFMVSMRDAGVNEQVVKSYFGDSYQYMTLAAALSEGAIDPQTALAHAYEAVNAPTGTKPRTNVNEVYKEWDNGLRQEFFDGIEPGMYAAMFGAPSDGQWDEVLTFQVEELAKNSTKLSNFVRDRIKTYARAFPTMNKEAVLSLAKKDVSQWEYVLGNLVPPKDGRSISQAMGLDETDGTLVSNSAALMYMQEHSDKLFPPGTEEAQSWNQFKDVLSSFTQGVSDATEAGIDYVIGEPTSFFHYLTFASERTQRLKNDIPMVDMVPMSNGLMMITMYKDTDKSKPVGVPIAVPMQDIGAFYKAKRKQQAFEDNLPRR